MVASVVAAGGQEDHDPGKQGDASGTQKGLERLKEDLSLLERDLDDLSLALVQLSEDRARRRLSPVRVTAVEAQAYQRSAVDETMTSAAVAAGSRGSQKVLIQALPALLLVAGGAAILVARLWSRRKRRQVSRTQTCLSTVSRSPRSATEDASPSCQVVFLCHPGSLLSIFALWFPPIRPLERWRRGWWMIPAWPVALAISAWNLFAAPRVAGPYILVDRYKHGGVTNEVWLSRAFGYQFMIKVLRKRIATSIEACAREADEKGVEVLGLGALNKAEFINHGGEDVLLKFRPAITRLVHGNTLTAAVVVENVKAAAQQAPACARGGGAHSSASPEARPRVAPPKPAVFLTGATSKVGRAVALKLALDGYDVVCCTSSEERFEVLRQELGLLASSLTPRGEPGASCPGICNSDQGLFAGAVASDAPAPEGTMLPPRNTGRLLRAERVDQGVRHRLWVVGKYDTDVRLHIPLNASAVVFAVPCPLEGSRPDVSNVTGGLVKMQGATCPQRRFHVLLPHDQMYACHAGALVHHRMGWTHHEAGKVDVARMDLTLRAAEACGFAVVSAPPSFNAPATAANDNTNDNTNYGAPREKRWPLGEDLEQNTAAPLLPRPMGTTIHRGATSSGGGRSGAMPRASAECSSAACAQPSLSWQASISDVLDSRGQRGTAAVPKNPSPSGSTVQTVVAPLCRPRTAVSADPTGLPLAAGSVPDFCRVVVVGGGASGLSAAACVKLRGEANVLVLERSGTVSGSWNAQYAGLHISTRRAHCGLPGWPIPRHGFGDNGDVLSAAAFVRYLDCYRHRFDLNVVHDADVLSADRDRSPAAGDSSGAAARRIVLRYRRNGGIRIIRCAHLVVATGKNTIPRMPLTVLQKLQGFRGEVIHSSKVQHLAAVSRSGPVCIVGMGNSACDLAIALLEEGASTVHISTRSAPPIIMRDFGPLSLEWTSRAVQYLPALLKDGILDLFGKAKWGVSWRSKAFPPGLPQTWRASGSNRIPCLDKGQLVPAMLDGRIEVHGPIDKCSGYSLCFEHSGMVQSFQTIVLATGFDAVHEGLLSRQLLGEGTLGGTYMVGFNNGRALLPLRQIGTDARHVAAKIVPRRTLPPWSQKK